MKKDKQSLQTLETYVLHVIDSKIGKCFYTHDLDYFSLINRATDMMESGKIEGFSIKRGKVTF